MIKPESLRAAIVALQPDLARDPDKLVMWVDQGTIRSNSTEAQGFAYRYRLNILLVDFAGEPSIIMLAVTNWLRANQPERVVPGQEAFAFEVDMIDSNTVGLQIRIQLDENVRVTRREDGGLHFVQVALRHIETEFVHPAPPSFDEYSGLSRTAKAIMAFCLISLVRPSSQLCIGVPGELIVHLPDRAFSHKTEGLNHPLRNGASVLSGPRQADCGCHRNRAGAATGRSDRAWRAVRRRILRSTLRR